MGRTVSALVLVLALGFMTSRADAADTDGYALSDFQLDTAADLIDICTLDAAHPHYPAAHSFCLGYFAGGQHYHRAVTRGPGLPPIACPDPGVTRDEAVDVFVVYMRANPQFLQEPPMEAVFRAAAAKWPCTK
jgi:hypothetical protein